VSQLMLAERVNLWRDTLWGFVVEHYPPAAESLAMLGFRSCPWGPAFFDVTTTMEGESQGVLGVWYSPLTAEPPEEYDSIEDATSVGVEVVVRDRDHGWLSYRVVRGKPVSEMAPLGAPEKAPEREPENNWRHPGEDLVDKWVLDSVSRHVGSVPGLTACEIELWGGAKLPGARSSSGSMFVPVGRKRFGAEEISKDVVEQRPDGSKRIWRNGAWKAHR